MNGWLLRADIQEHEPRDGLKQTTDYIEAHFGGNLQINVVIAHLRTVLAARAKSPSVKPGR